MSHIGDASWRCCNDTSKFCPPEGCPKLARTASGEWAEYGCARAKGWDETQPSPRECQGLLPVAAVVLGGGGSNCVQPEPEPTPEPC